MSAEWTKVTLADAPLTIMDGDRGTNYPSQDDFSSVGHCLFLNTGNVTTDGFNFSNCAFITVEKDSALRKGKLCRDDVVLTTRGTVGNVGFFGDSVQFEHIRINSGMVILRADQRQLSSYFLYLFVRSALFMEQVKSLQSGSAQPQLPIRDMKRIEIPIPPMPDQVDICAVLGALDDRITLLRETNATLEAIAQALFKSWFVDFDPVRAKLEGRAPEGMDEATARLFPDSFEESELGLVPRGWRVGQLGHEVKIAYGKNLPTSKLLASGYPVYGGNGQIGFSDKFIYQSRQVLVACRGAASGKFNQSVPRSFVTNNSLVLESSDATPLLFGYLKGCISCADLIPFVTGSAQPQVTIDNLKNFKLLVPSDAAVRAFESFSAPIEDAIEANSQQAQTLATLRDTLLPRLISGQLRLPEADSLLEGIAA